MAFERPPDEIGTLWLEVSRDGSKTYYKGKIDGIGEVICWPGETKTGKKLLRVKKSQPREQRESAPSWKDLTGGEEVPF